MTPQSSLLNKIQHMSMSCDHLCKVGYITRGDNLSLIDRNFVFTGLNADSVHLFNFCPGCGQELNIETHQQFTEIVKFKENK
jgi:hypothetical protein